VSFQANIKNLDASMSEVLLLALFKSMK